MTRATGGTMRVTMRRTTNSRALVQRPSDSGGSWITGAERLRERVANLPRLGYPGAMRARLLLSALLLSTAVTASQSACAIFYECIYVTLSGYQVCANLEPVISTDLASGEAVEIVDANGFPPSGCTCMHPGTAEIWDASPLDPQLDPLYDQMQEDARVACEALAIEVGADPTPCDAALLDEPTAQKGPEKSASCPFADGSIDDNPNCPPGGEDEVVFETGEATDTATDTDEGGVIIIPDLPKQP